MTVVIVVTMEAQLGQIVQEKVELSEPGAKGILNHASKYGCRLGSRFVWQQSLLNEADCVGVHSRYVGSCHQCEQVQQIVTVLAKNIKRL